VLRNLCTLLSNQINHRFFELGETEQVFIVQRNVATISICDERESAETVLRVFVDKAS